jgi:hypothetical protein
MIRKLLMEERHRWSVWGYGWTRWYHFFFYQEGRTEQVSSNCRVCDSNFWGTRFESQARHQLYWLWLVLVFLSSSRQMLRQYYSHLTSFKCWISWICVWSVERRGNSFAVPIFKGRWIEFLYWLFRGIFSCVLYNAVGIYTTYRQIVGWLVNYELDDTELSFFVNCSRTLRV